MVWNLQKASTHPQYQKCPVHSFSIRLSYRRWHGGHGNCRALKLVQSKVPFFYEGASEHVCKSSYSPVSLPGMDVPLPPRVWIWARLPSLRFSCVSGCLYDMLSSLVHIWQSALILCFWSGKCLSANAIFSFCCLTLAPVSLCDMKPEECSIRFKLFLQLLLETVVLDYHRAVLLTHPSSLNVLILYPPSNPFRPLLLSRWQAQSHLQWSCEISPWKTSS